MRPLRLAARLAIPVLVATLAGSPAAASISDPAQAIVAHYIEATGGAAALAAHHAVHVKGRLSAMEMKGTFEQWTQVPDRLVTRESLGSIRLRTGFDGTVGWRTDLSSKQVTLLDGKELEQSRSDAYFENEMWARADQGGGKVMCGSSAFRNGEEYQSLEITPPVGPGRRLWFSVRTGLMSRAVVRRDQRESDLWFSEYRVLAGRKLPTVQGASDDESQIRFDPHDEAGVARLTVDSLWASAGFDPAVFAAPASKESPLVWLRTKGVAHVPFRYGSRHVWLRASINGGSPADFLLDTGASLTMIDKSYAQEIGIAIPIEGKMQVQGMGGTSEASFGRVGNIRVSGPDGDGVTLSDFKVGVVDFSESDELVMWRKMSGLIGYDFLSRFAVEIDYDRGIVTFYEPKSFAYRGAGGAIDMRLTSGVPTVSATLDGKCSGEFLVDVGNSFGLTVHGSLVRSCGMIQAASGRKQVEVLSGGIGDSFTSWLCRLDRIAIGPFEWKDPIAGLSLRTKGMVGSQDFAGNIGNGVLERFKVTIDYERKKLYLEPGRRYRERDRYSRSGTLFLRLKDRVFAGDIVRGSAADEAGLKPMDEVTAIDGQPILSITPEEIDRMFVEGEIGTEHELTVVRHGKPATLKLVLQDVL